MKRVFLTTTDNPYDPSKDFINWFNYDISHGYNTCQKLAKIANTSNGLSENENLLIKENAIDDIIDLHSGVFYKKVITEE